MGQEKRLEEVLCLVFIHSFSLILDMYLKSELIIIYRIFVIYLSSDFDDPSFLELGSIWEEIKKHLLQPPFVER